MNKSPNLNDVCVMCGKYYISEGEGMICPECLQNGGPIVLVKNIHIENSYKTWRPDTMWSKIIMQSWFKYHNIKADRVLNRSYRGMYLEWYLHNIGYYLTLPFIKNQKILTLNKRFKHVDLEEHRKNISSKNK